MKKFFAAILGMVCVFTCMALTACNSKNTDYNETFEGYVSLKTYETSESAAQAFLEEELSGKTTQTTFISYTQTAELTETDIDKLALTESERSKVTSAEKGVVTYSESVRSAEITAFSAADNSNRKTKEIVILREDSVFRYYVSAMVVGGEITRSYYEYVFDRAKYKNFTATGNQTVLIKSDVKINGMSTPSTETTEKSSHTCKFTDNAVYLINQSSGMTVEALFVQTADGLKKFTNISYQDDILGANTNGWVQMEGTLSGVLYAYISSVDDLISMVNYDYFDQTYFVKTDTGFSCRVDRYKEAAMIMYEKLFNFEFDLGIDLNQIMSDIMDSTKISVDFFVRDGRIADSSGKMVIDYNFSYSEYMEMTLYEESSYNYSYKGFGTTTIEIPEVVQQYLA